MNQTSRPAEFERTVEQKGEERRIRELHRQNPVREIPTETIRGADAAQLLRFIALIQREREAQGLTLEQLAEQAGIEVAALSRLETGTAFNPTIATLFRIAGALGKNLAIAFEGDSRKAE